MLTTLLLLHFVRNLFNYFKQFFIQRFIFLFKQLLPEMGRERVRWIGDHILCLAMDEHCMPLLTADYTTL